MEAATRPGIGRVGFAAQHLGIDTMTQMIERSRQALTELERNLP